MDPYCYRPLTKDHIRVLWLEPGQLGTPLRAQLRHGQPPPPQDRAPFSSPFPKNPELRYCVVPRDVWQKTRDADMPEEALDYMAISYAWGSSQLTATIIIDEQYHICITKSLYEALQYLRSPEDCYSFWADAVCINQVDLVEKSKQVAIMDDIYRRASGVHIWLGLGEGHDWLAFSLLRAVGIEVPDQKHEPDTTISEDTMALELINPKRNCSCCSTSASTDPREVYDQALIAVRHVFRRPYFQRLWVAQEVALAPKRYWLHSGSHITNFQETMSLITWGHHLPPAKPKFVRELPWSILHHVLTIDYLSDGECLDFTHILLFTWHLACVNPLDRIYGIMGMVADPAHKVVPDYSADCMDLYRHVTLMYPHDDHSSCEQSHGMEPLASVDPFKLLCIAPLSRTNSNTYSKWPSWVPDYNNMTRQSEISIQRCYRNTADRKVMRTAKSKSENHLSIAGNVSGIVTSVLGQTDIMESTGFHVRFFNELGEDYDHTRFGVWIQRCALYLQEYQEAMKEQASAVKMYCGDGRGPLKCSRGSTSCMLDDAVHAKDDGTCTDERHALFIVLMLLQTGTDTAAKALMSLLRGEASMTRFLLGHIDPCRLIATIETTQGTFVGWVPAWTEAGDQVCLFRGAPFPFILRAAEDDLFLLVGDACIPGLRELADIADENEGNDQHWITLC